MNLEECSSVILGYPLYMLSSHTQVFLKTPALNSQNLVLLTFYELFHEIRFAMLVNKLGTV